MYVKINFQILIVVVDSCQQLQIQQCLLLWKRILLGETASGELLQRDVSKKSQKENNFFKFLGFFIFFRL